ncbi:MAG: MATE family efflux transporter [Coprobacillus sp.]|nr:MATE family efflux transporter [Coprobacillus sp.]
MKLEKNKLGYEKISKLLLSLAIPSIIAQLVNVLYNMVDRIYIGQMSDGTLAMASLSVALPILTFVTAFTNLVGVGGAPLCAIRMGEKRQDKAEEIMTNSFVMLIGLGFILTIIILIFKEPLLLLFGANEETLPQAISYISIYALGTVFVQITLGMNAYINTQGFAKMGMCTVMIGAILNIILDPIFIFGLNMGVSGAALATILAQGVSALWVLVFLFGKKSIIKIRKQYVKLNLRICFSIISLGISPFVMGSTESLLQISFNNQLSLYGGTMAVATMAILLSLWQFITLPLQGLCQGAQPILSYNYGAKNYTRVRETFKLVFKLCLGFAIIAGGSVMIFSKFFVSIFASDPQTIEFASWALRIYLLGSGIFGAQIACQQSFMALGQAKISLCMAITRKIILLIPLIYIFPYLIGGTSLASMMSSGIAPMVKDGASVFAVLFAEPVSDILAACITTYMFIRFYKKELKQPDQVIES